MVSPKIYKEFAVKLFEEAQPIIKSGKTKEAIKLLDKKKTPVQVGPIKKEVTEGAETVTKITKKDIKVKKPEVSVDQADEALFLYKGTVITPKILDDFNIHKFSSKGDFIKFIDIISKQSRSAFEKQKRGVQTHEHTKAIGTLIGKNQEHLQRTLLDLKPGQTLNAQWIFAARELLEAGMTKLDDMAKRMTDISRAGQVTSDEQLAFRQHFALMAEYQKILKGVQTETARALNQFKIPTRSKKFSSLDLDELNKQALLVELGGGDQIQAVAKLYLQTGSQVGKAKFTQQVGLKANLTKVSNSIAEIFLNVILSNPYTHVKNTGGNWITMGINNLERRVGAWRYGGKIKDGLAEFEDYAKIYGKTMAAEEMKIALGQAMKQKKLWKFLQTFDQHIASNFGGTSKIELHGRHATAENFNVTNQFGATMIDGLGSALTLGRVPTRFLNVMDNWFKNQEYRSELYALAYRETMQMWREGWLKQNKMADYLADRIVNPTKVMMEAAYDGAHYVTYQNKLNKQPGNSLATAGNLLQKGKTKTGMMSWLANYYLPFIQTPTNIATFVSERTPLLAKRLTRYKDEIAAGGARAQMAKVRLQLGTLFYLTSGTAGYFGGASGTDINVPGATTGGKRELLKAFGYQPNSLRIPVGDDKYVQINLTGLDPINLMTAMGANSGQALNLALDSGADPEALAAHAFALTYGMGEMISNSTYMMGVGSAAKDMRNLTRFLSGDVSNRGAQKWWNRFSSAFVPGFFKQIGKNIPHINEEGNAAWFNDDMQKLAVEWNEFMLRNIKEDKLEWDYNILGERYEKFGLFSTFKKTDVSEALEKVMPDIRPIRDYVEYTYANGLSVGIPLNSKELRFYKKNAGINFVNKMRNEVFTNPLWKDETEEIVKKKLITTALSDARSEAKDQLFDPQYGYIEELRKRGDEIKIKKIISEQGGKPILEDNFGILKNDNINNNN